MIGSALYTHDAREKAKVEILLNGKSWAGPSDTVDDNFCSGDLPGGGGQFTVQVTAEADGAGVLRVGAGLPDLRLGEWRPGHVYRKEGMDWTQLVVPAGR